MSVLSGSRPDAAVTPERATPARPPFGARSRAAAWAPAVLVAAVAVMSLARSGTSSAAIVAYAVYWLVAVVTPGALLARALIGPRRFLPEDLAIGATTGLAVQLAVWLVARPLGLPFIATWWWLAVIVVFVAVPRLRVLAIGGPAATTPPWWAWSLAGVSALTVLSIDWRWLRANPLPGDGGVAHVDAWWHAAIVKEFLRDGPSQIPQVAGERFNYTPTPTLTSRSRR